MTVKPKTKKQQAIELAEAGKSRKEIAATVYPDSKPATAATAVTRALKGSNGIVQPFVQDALDNNQIEIDKIIADYKTEMQATKDIYFKGDLVATVPDYGIRQKAKEALLKLMQAYVAYVPQPDGDDVPVANPEAARALIQAIKDGNIEAIERVVFKPH